MKNRTVLSAHIAMALITKGTGIPPPLISVYEIAWDEQEERTARNHLVRKDHRTKLCIDLLDVDGVPGYCLTTEFGVYFKRFCCRQGIL